MGVGIRGAASNIGNNIKVNKEQGERDESGREGRNTGGSVGPRGRTDANSGALRADSKGYSQNRGKSPSSKNSTKKL